jgi:hypothetical protein
MKLSDILLEFSEHYGTLDKRDTAGYDEYHGRYIVWLGEKGRMIKATPHNSEPIWGNIFDQDKINKTAEDIRYAEDNVKMYAPYGMATILDVQDVEENLQAAAHGDLMYDPAINDYHLYTTGDEELDAYLLDSEEFIGDNAFDDDEIEALETKMEQMKTEAQEDEWGDIGDISIQVRDGNHRRAAAFELGESYIWVTITDVDDKIKGHLQ